MELKTSLIDKRTYQSNDEYNFHVPLLVNNKTMPPMMSSDYIELVRPRRNSMDDQHEKTNFRTSQPLNRSSEHDAISEDSDITVLSFEQINPQSFKCVNLFRPLFWLLYYLFCCCIFPSCYSNVSEGNKNILATFQRTLKTLKTKRFPDSEVFNALVQLYRCKANAFVLLQRVRLNPSLSKDNKVRTDLEFFIPQICSFYLNPEIDDNQRTLLIDILAKACTINYFFAHRVYFFFKSAQSYLVDADQQAKANFVISRLAKCVVLNNSQSGNEILYLTDSLTFLKFAN